MARGKRYQSKQVVNLLRQIEVAVANGKTAAQVCKETEIVEQTYFRWLVSVGSLRQWLNSLPQLTNRQLKGHKQ